MSKDTIVRALKESGLTGGLRDYCLKIYAERGEQAALSAINDQANNRDAHRRFCEESAAREYTPAPFTAGVPFGLRKP